MQSVSARIWTHVGVSISDDDNHYTTGTSRCVCAHLICFSLLTYKYPEIYKQNVYRQLFKVPLIGLSLAFSFPHCLFAAFLSPSLPVFCCCYSSIQSRLSQFVYHSRPLNQHIFYFIDLPVHTFVPFINTFQQSIVTYVAFLPSIDFWAYRGRKKKTTPTNRKSLWLSLR